MARQFEINGIKYIAKEFDYNMICDLQDNGIDLKDMKKKASSTARAYLAICSGMEIPEAGNEIMQHMIKGGSLDELFEVLGQSLEDFFRLFPQDNGTEEVEQKTTKSTSKKTAATK